MLIQFKSTWIVLLSVQGPVSVYLDLSSMYFPNISFSRVRFISVGKDEARGQLDSALQDVNVRYAVLEETEKRAVCRALIEERARYCSFVSMLKPVLVSVCLCVRRSEGLFSAFKAGSIRLEKLC